MIVNVTDIEDSRLDAFRWRDRQLASKSERLETVGAGLFVAEGDLVVERARLAGCEPVAILCAQKISAELSQHFSPDIAIYVADDKTRGIVTGLGVPLDVTGLFRRPALRSVTQLCQASARIVVLEEVDNPTNLGAIMRSAVALGWDALLLDSTSADPLARRALRVSMGTTLQLPFSRCEPGTDFVSLLHQHGFSTIALTPDSSATELRSIDCSTQKIALLLGSERSGLSERVLHASTYRARIVMKTGIDSLNVGAAAAIALHVFAPANKSQELRR